MEEKFPRKLTLVGLGWLGDALTVSISQVMKSSNIRQGFA